MNTYSRRLGSITYSPRSQIVIMSPCLHDDKYVLQWGCGGVGGGRGGDLESPVDSFSEFYQVFPTIFHPPTNVTINTFYFQGGSNNDQAGF